MGLRRGLIALAMLLLVTGLSAQQLESDDKLDLDELTLQNNELDEPCSLPEYGRFGVFDEASSNGAGSGPSPGKYGQYGAAPGQYGAAAGQYGAAAAPGGYGSSAAAELMHGKQCKPLFVPGRLLSIGGLANCTGSFTPLAPQLSALASTSETDAMGRFNQTGATLGTFSWKASSQCVDSVTGLPLTYNWQLVSPVFDYMVITDLTLLTTPASAGLPPLARGSGDVHDQVFKAFGIDATKLQIDMITYENVTSASPVWPALMGINAQLSFIAHAVANTLVTLKNGPEALKPQQPQQQQQQLAQLSDIVGIQDAIWSVVQGSAKGDGQALLASRELIREVFAESAKLNHLPELDTGSRRGQEVLFDSVARIIATSNKDMLKPLVDVAMSCATAALAGMPRITPECSVTSLAASVTSVTLLQKVNMTNDIELLTKAYVITGDPVNTPDNIVVGVPLPTTGSINDTALEPLDDRDDDDDDDEDDVEDNSDRKRAESIKDPVKKPIEILYKRKLWTPIANWVRSLRLRRQEGRQKHEAMGGLRPRFKPVPMAGKVPDGYPDYRHEPEEEQEYYNRPEHLKHQNEPKSHKGKGEHEDDDHEHQHEDKPHKPAHPKRKSTPKHHKEEEKPEEYTGHNDRMPDHPKHKPTSKHHKEEDHTHKEDTTDPEYPEHHHEEEEEEYSMEPPKGRKHTKRPHKPRAAKHTPHTKAPRGHAKDTPAHDPKSPHEPEEQDKENPGQYKPVEEQYKQYEQPEEEHYKPYDSHDQPQYKQYHEEQYTEPGDPRQYEHHPPGEQYEPSQEPHQQYKSAVDVPSYKDPSDPEQYENHDDEQYDSYKQYTDDPEEQYKPSEPSDPEAEYPDKEEKHPDSKHEPKGEEDEEIYQYKDKKHRFRKKHTTPKRPAHKPHSKDEHDEEHDKKALHDKKGSKDHKKQRKDTPAKQSHKSHDEEEHHDSKSSPQDSHTKHKTTGLKHAKKYQRYHRGRKSYKPKDDYPDKEPSKEESPSKEQYDKEDSPSKEQYDKEDSPSKEQYDMEDQYDKDYEQYLKEREQNYHRYDRPDPEREYHPEPDHESDLQYKAEEEEVYFGGKAGYHPEEHDKDYDRSETEQDRDDKSYLKEEDEAEYDPYKAEQYPEEEEEEDVYKKKKEDEEDSYKEKEEKDVYKEKKEAKEEDEEEWSPKPSRNRHQRKAPRQKKWPTMSRVGIRVDRRMKQEAKKLAEKCGDGYDPEVCKHDLRPECDYHQYKDGEYPPEDCHPYKSYPKSAAKALVSTAQVDSDSWGNVEPDGVSQVPPTRKGLMGLLGLLGMMGAVGVVPAGGLLMNTLAPLPTGTIVITPGLVLAPHDSPLSAQQSKGVLPWSFGGNCGILGGHLDLEKVSGNTPADILKQIPQSACLPRGWLYKVSNLAEAGFSPNLAKLPPGTVVLKDDTLYLPKSNRKDNNIINMLAKAIPNIEQAEWTTPKRAEEVVPGTGVKVLEVDEKHYVIINDASGHARLGDPSAHLQESQEPQPTILLHGNADCIPQGAPPASCAQGATLGAVGLLSAKPENALAPVNLEGAAVGIGYVQGCGGDFFSYNKLVGAVEDVQKLSIDRRSAGVFKAFTTGDEARSQQTWGSFGVGNVTGRGHAFLTNTWACPGKVPEDAPVCIDSWTGVKIKVPIGGLMPYPKDYKRDKTANVDVVMSPLALTTLVNVNSSSDVSAAYKESFITAAQLKLGAGALTADPVRMVKSGKLPLVKQGVAIMVENAKVLNTLTTARALYECRSAPSPELSNELFVQWAEKLVSKGPMTRPGPLKTALKELCLENPCSDNAAAALLMINKYLGMIRSKYDSLKADAKVPLSLGDDLVILAQLAHVGQAELYDAIRSCCGLTGATSAGPLDDFVHRMEDLKRMAAIKTADVQQAAAMSLGGGVDASSSGAADSSSSGGRSTDSLESSTTSMVGTLLNNGGIRDCKGILYPLVEGESPLSLLTDPQGQFIVDEPLEGIYKFSSNKQGSSCIDSLTGVPVTFPMIQQVPATMAATITAISLLSGPAKSDPAVRELVSVNGQVSPELLVNYVYRLYGLDAEELNVDFFSFTGDALKIGSPRLAQVSGAIAQTMATYMTGHSMLTALFTGKVSSDQIAQCIVAATYNKISKAGNAIATLTEQEGLTSIYKAAHARCAPPARRRALLSADAETPGPAYAGIAAAFKDANPNLPNTTDSGEVWEQLASAMSNPKKPDASKFGSTGKDAAAAAADAKPASQAAVSIASAAGAEAPEDPAAIAAAKGAGSAKKGMPAAAAVPAQKSVGTLELSDLFAAAARVVAVGNQKIQQSVVQADRAATTRAARGNFTFAGTMANISGVAAVQQSDFAKTVGQLASTVAADVEEGDTHDLQRGLFQTQIAELEESFTGDALQDRIRERTATITPAAVARNLGNIGQTLAVDDDGRIGVFVAQSPKPKARVHPGIIAGAAVGGALLLAALGALIFYIVRRRRKAVASAPFAPSVGSTPFASSEAAAAAVASPRKLKLIGRRSSGTERSEGSTPRSTAGPVAEAVLEGQSGGSSVYRGPGSGKSGVLLMNNNPLFSMPKSPVRSPAGNLRDLE